MEDEMYLVADKYKELRDEKTELEGQLKSVNEEIEVTGEQLIQMMVDREMDSFKRKGVQFVCIKSVSPNAIPELKDELYAELKKHGYEDWFTVNTNTLKARVKELTELNDGVLPEWLQGYIREFERQSISIRKS